MTTITRTFFAPLLAIWLIASATCTNTGASGRAKHTGDVAMIVDATELARAFEENAQHATELFSGKRARISGAFAKSEPLADGNFALMFKTSRGTFRPVRCVIDATDSNAINRLSEGEDVTMTGTIRGFTESTYFISVDDCSVDRP